MPDFGIGEAIAAISAFAGDALAGGAAAASGIAADAGAGIAGLAGAGEAGLAGLASGAEGLASGAADFLGLGGAAGEAGGAASGVTGLAGAAATDPLAAAAAGGAPAIAGGAAPAGAGAIDLASTAGAGGSQALSFAPDISAADWVLPDGSVLPGAGGGSTGFDLAGAASGGAQAGGSAATTAGGDLASLAGGGAKEAVAATAEGAASGGAGGGGSFFSNLGTSALSSLTKNPLGIAAAGAGLGYNILQGQKLSNNQQALTGLAQQEAGQGAQLQQYLQNGTLPPGMQAQVDQSKAAAKAQIISGYASRGQNADPSQNSALAQELAAVDTNALELQGKIATNLLTAGINETNMSANLFQALIQMDQTQAKQMGSAISNFASALAGGPKTINIGSGATA